MAAAATRASAPNAAGDARSASHGSAARTAHSARVPPHNARLDVLRKGHHASASPTATGINAHAGKSRMDFQRASAELDGRSLPDFLLAVRGPAADRGAEPR